MYYIYSYFELAYFRLSAAGSRCSLACQTEETIFKFSFPTYLPKSSLYICPFQLFFSFSEKEQLDRQTPLKLVIIKHVFIFFSLVLTVFRSYQRPSLNTDMKTRGRTLHYSPADAPKDHINPFSTAVLQEPTTHHKLHFFGPTLTTISIFLISFHFCLYVRQNSLFLDV